MIYIYRVRRLVKVVRNEMLNSTDPLSESGTSSYHHCLSEFRGLSKKYTQEVANQTQAIATGQGYLKLAPIVNSRNDEQRLVVTDKGAILLTNTGFMNAWLGSVSNITPAAAVFIALLALGVSIWSAIIASGKPPTP